MRTKQKWALTLLTALGAMSCGDSQPVDPYQSFIDGTRLDAKFQPTAGCGPLDKEGKPSTLKCYQYSKGWFNGEERSFHNLALTTPKDQLVKTSTATGISYDFPEGCATGKPFDQRKDTYPEDIQYSVFDTLPLSTSAIPLVRVKGWTGVSSFTCNAIKNDQSLKDGVFGGGEAEGESYAVRAIIDPTFAYARPNDTAPLTQFTYGWHRALLLAYLDGGPVPVDGNGNVKTMDGLWLKPSSSSAKPTDLNARLVFQARPGEANWSPVVRLREVSVSANTTFKSLCYTEPCPEDAFNMATTPVTYTGVLFLGPVLPAVPAP
ncbi:hypothetical protein CYFUS_009589 [Cystobacter fuscus]|uniref:Lipoprotein n=1 Tax=Cystobacter fuscus TaxID=43 RepID=A0A250JKF4_9BACT|nr:hypothetical protein [Cystobacter fuscus]ATB44108.1 hypothetical protein CYFUS_009589 [Cystobacter fuscus]